MNERPCAELAGWYGKLPSLGDFASRRLGPEVIEHWDAWLARILRSLQQRPDWPDVYLVAPSWRFCLMPGVLPGAQGRRAWAGVLMPSVDRVGRYFPLTVLLPLEIPPRDAEALRVLWAWLASLDDAAADALHDDWSPERLDAELARVPTSPELASQGGVACTARASYWYTATEDWPERQWVSQDLPDPALRLFVASR